MTGDRVQVLIVGAGPSGSTLGSLLAERGVHVRIVDKATFPRSKPCGECLNPGAVQILGRTGLLEAVIQCRPAALSGWHLTTREGTAATGMFPRTQRGLALSREALDDCLLREAVKRGVEVHQGRKVIAFERQESGGVVVSIRRVDGSIGGTRTDLVVGADGLRSTVSRRLGLLGRRPRLRKLSLTCHLIGYGPDRSVGALHLGATGTRGEDVTLGLAPIHADEPLWNGTVVIDGTKRKVDGSDRKRLFQTLFDQGPFGWSKPPTVVAGPWTSGPFDWPTRCTVAADTILVGDAAGYFDPLAGQGIHHALRSAELAADCIVECLNRGSTGAGDLIDYHRKLRREMRFDWGCQHAIEAVISRPATRYLAIGLLGAAPWLANRIVAITGHVVRSRKRQQVGQPNRPLAWREPT